MSFSETLAFIEQHHAGQTRNDGVTPYFNHVSGVLGRTEKRIVRDTIPEPLATHYREASGCHDLIEECSNLTLADLPISAAARHSVSLLTRWPGQSYNKYVAAVLTDLVATMVKIDDVLTNLSDDPTDDQIRRYSELLPKLLAGLHQHRAQQSNLTPVL